MKNVLIGAVALLLAACGGGGGGGGDASPQEPEKAAGVVVFVHGGGWTMAPPVLPAPLSKGLPELAARYGFNYAAITYPLATDQHHSFPDAHRSVVSQLIELKRGHNKVYVIGTSAGANIVALAALESPESMDKVAMIYGVYDLPAMDEEFNELYSNKYASDLYAASPSHIGHISIPHWLWHGSADALVPYTQSLYWDDRHTTIVDGAGHGFTILDWIAPDLESFLFNG